nr:MAG: putative RNA-dependent RNA polymerase [Barnaviridae sp.]
MTIKGLNKEILDSPSLRAALQGDVENRLKELIRCGKEVICQSSNAELVAGGLCDPIRLFIKQEPHKKNKVAIGKLRLISGVSIVDQIIDRMLHSCQNKLEIQLWETHPSKPGIGLDDEGLQSMARQFKEMFKKSPEGLRSTDISGWDWSVQDWEIMEDYRYRELLCGGQNTLWSYLAWARAYIICRKVYVLSDSSLISPTIPGIQASGSYNTSSTNSRMRVIARAVAYELWASTSTDATAIRARPDWGNYYDSILSNVVAMGDDCVEGKLPEPVYSKLAELGHNVKDVSDFTTVKGVEFCSHRWFEDGLAVPINWDKTLFKFTQQPDDPNQLPGLVEQLLGDTRNIRDPQISSAIQEAIAAKLQAAKFMN